MELIYFGFPFVLIAFIGGFHGGLMRRHYVYMGVSVLALYTLFFLLDDVITNHRGEFWRATIFLGSFLITIGWMVTNEISLQNNRRHHTINLITDYISGDRHIKDRQQIRGILPHRHNKLTTSHINFDDENTPLTQAIDRDLNFFEFAAIGVASGDLDHQIVRETLRPNLLSFYEQMESYINHWRSKDEETWKNLVNLYRKWRH